MLPLTLLAAILVTVLNAVWLISLVFQLPGTWLILLTTAAAAWWRSEDAMYSWWPLGALLVLAIVGEIIETFASMAGSSKAGGGKAGAIGGVLGAIIGAIAGTAIPIPIIGSLIGACVGAGLGAILFELPAGREWGHTLRIGQGAAVGRFWGTLGKLGVGAVMWLIAAVGAFW